MQPPKRDAKTRFCSALSLDEDFKSSLYANRNIFEAFATRKPKTRRESIWLGMGGGGGEGAKIIQINR